MQLDSHEESNRIAYLDGLRCVAILLVVFYHYFSRWTMPTFSHSLYPYGSSFEKVSAYGGFGVPLFFVVSGFVIAMTITNCADARTFAIKRWARLWPPLLLCGTLTFLLEDFVIPNQNFHVSVLSFVPSLTFLDPKLFWITLHNRRFEWIDGSYWSLYPEVRFYLIFGLLYFCAGARFARNLSLATIANMAICWWSMSSGERRYLQVNLLLGVDHFPWFMIGVSFFWMHIHAEPMYRKILLGLALFTLVGNSYLRHQWPAFICAVAVPALVWLAGRFAVVGGFLSNRFMKRIGRSSYSLYLLHQHVGVALIGWLGLKLGLSGPGSAWLAIMMILLMIEAAHFLFVAWEMPTNRLISRWLIGPPTYREFASLEAALPGSCVASDIRIDT